MAVKRMAIVVTVTVRVVAVHTLDLQGSSLQFVLRAGDVYVSVSFFGAAKQQACL